MVMLVETETINLWEIFLASKSETEGHFLLSLHKIWTATREVSPSWPLERIQAKGISTLASLLDLEVPST